MTRDSLGVIWLTLTITISKTFDANYAFSGAIRFASSLVSQYKTIPDYLLWNFFRSTRNNVKKVSECLRCKKGMLRHTERKAMTPSEPVVYGNSDEGFPALGDQRGTHVGQLLLLRQVSDKHTRRTFA